MAQKPLLTAEELDALLTKPAEEVFTDDKYFPLRLFVILLAMFVWFIRLTVFTEETAANLFADPLVREYMKTALYFRAWIMFAFLFIGFVAYRSEKYPALFFLGMFIVASVNFVADMTIFYKDQFAHPTLAFNLMLLFRFLMCYFLFISMRNANRIPKGNDKWNIFLPFKKHTQSQNSAY
jgi:magnesium-transporting ATPase (P-type)